MGDGIVPPAPEPDSTAAYGKYLAESVANCRGCHTNRDMMTGAYIGLKALFKHLHSLEPVHAATPVGIQEGDPF